MKQKYFDKHAFLAYLEDVYVGFSGNQGRFLRETVENLIDYGLKHKSTSKDDLVYFLYDVLPDELRLGEIAACCDDSMLTNNLLEAKQEWLAKVKAAC